MADTVKDFIKSEFLRRVEVAKMLADVKPLRRAKPLRRNNIIFERVSENCIEVLGCSELAEILKIKPNITYYLNSGRYGIKKISFIYQGVEVFSEEGVILDENPEGAVIVEEEKWST